MYKAVFFRTEKGFFGRFFSKNRCLFLKNRVKYIYNKLYNPKYKRLFNIAKNSLKKSFQLIEWKKAGKDLTFFVFNVSLEGLAINFITFVVFKDSLHFFKFLAYGLIPMLIIYYIGKLKNGDGSRIFQKKSSDDF
jgi:hypothetical protein